MDIESRKYKMIEKLLKVEEDEVLYRLEAILDEKRNAWDELNPEIKQAIDISLEQSTSGKVKAHEEVMMAIKKKYNIA
ncbi:hypothetical protein E0W68_03525 [Flavobacterium salilacus subsp. salilacus]|uniref:hypothetical protein n=1 Tax=Flavobacterium TaxID=237 RepID=UPI001074A020|nr:MULTISPECIES: hypothetical protein [Flavobacterium]KAF2519432.1 hypothetical protein E0W68_03525 [Flavobacterium salilacus subsp. salilacus]MBE1614676.1 hypothetical protein [Flavobacterium sp. SaA2.13]